MKTSLREKLNLLIRQRGQISYNEIKTMCESGAFGRKYRISNLERRLRGSESPDVKSVMSGNHIAYYQWVGEPMRYQKYKVLLPDGKIDKLISIPEL